MKVMRQLALLPPHIAVKSISKSEIVLPITEALEAIDLLESKGVHILGWEGWIRTADGRVGHGNAPQGTVSLEKLTIKAAAQICRETIKEDSCLWMQENPGATDELHFCITVRV